MLSNHETKEPRYARCSFLKIDFELFHTNSKLEDKATKTDFEQVRSNRVLHF